MTIANQLIIEAEDGRSKDLKSLLNIMVEAALLEKGCQKYELYQLDEDRELFFIIEIWKSEKHYNAHFENETFKAISEEMKELVEIEVKNPLKLTQCLTTLGLKNKEA
ncbi:MAG: putative quinol monooxygenase [Helicobacteraceae bacterium]|jgi:quinol monooxygenase YgiN|nr:putative quinol monooxygenase [Helicobacteraceae bacterium]